LNVLAIKGDRACRAETCDNVIIEYSKLWRAKPSFDIEGKNKFACVWYVKNLFTTLTSFSSVVENTSRKECKVAFSGAIMPSLERNVNEHEKIAKIFSIMFRLRPQIASIRRCDVQIVDNEVISKHF
jgi:hypothetical protein